LVEAGNETLDGVRGGSHWQGEYWGRSGSQADATGVSE
jgi:hypothetical protein